MARFFATCSSGLEETLAAELAGPRIGATGIAPGSSGVWFSGGQETGYRANLWLRSAVRVLVELERARVRDPDELYRFASDIDWENLMKVDQTLAVDCRLRDSGITHSKYAALKVKDAICDRFRRITGRRPDVDVEAAHLPLFLYLWRDEATLYRDMSGQTLHKRGYRGAVHRAALSEAVAAGILQMIGFDGTQDIVDPMCGSGTFVIEAALIATERAPGLLRRRSFPFEHWPFHDATLWERLRREAREAARDRPGCRILGADSHPGAITLARRDADAAGVSRQIELVEADIEDLTLAATPQLVVTNPPWGERLDAADAVESWRRLGHFLKASAQGARAHVLCGNADLSRHLGLKSARRRPLSISRVDCRMLEYEIQARER